MLLIPWIVGFFAAFLALQSEPSVDTQIRQHLESAQKAERATDYANAGRQYQEILKLQPNNALVHQSLAVVYHLQNLYPQAIAEFQRALTVDPTLWGSQLFLGLDYYKINQFALSIAPLQESIALNAKMAEPEARFWLGVTYSALNEPEKAVVQLRRALELRPADGDVFYRLTLAYDQAATSMFQQLGKIEPGAAVVSILQAERFLTENRADLARLEYRNAIRLRPDLAGWIPALADQTGSQRASEVTISAHDARVNVELAGWLAARGDGEQAVSNLHKFAMQKPADAQAAALIATGKAQLARLAREPKPERQSKRDEALAGLALLRQGRFSDAVPLLAGASEHDPNVWLGLSLVRGYLESDDCEHAEQAVRQVLAAEPRNVDALHLLGRNYKRLAELTLQKMIDIDPDSYGVHELLGKRHEERTEYELAIREYQAALAKRPDSGGVRYAIGNVYWNTKQNEQAEQWLTEELKRNPYHGLAHYRLGSIYVEQGKADEAIAHLEQALQSHPDMTGAQFELGRAYAAMGRAEDAIAMLQKAAAADPENDRVHYLLSNTYQKQGRKTEAQTEMAKYQELTRKRLERAQRDVNAASDALNKKP
jgi:tetratricopeptide (TPR) repeat protein